MAADHTSAQETPRMVAIVMSEEAALALSEACQFGKYRVEDWLDNVSSNPDRMRHLASIQAALDWGQNWLIHGKRIEVPSEPVPKVCDCEPSVCESDDELYHETKCAVFNVPRGDR